MRLIVLLILFLHSGSPLPPSIKIGLFDMADTIHEIAFRYAVDRINNDRDILPRTQLTAQIERIPPQDSFYASKRVCKALSDGLGGIFGPQSGVTSTHVQSICDSLEVPHVETRYDYRLTRDDYSINLYPHPHALGQAFVDLVSAMKWKKFTVLYEKSEGLVRLQEVLKLSSNDKDMKITIRQLTPGLGGDYRPLLKSMKTSGETQIILDCLITTVPDVLKQAQQVGIMTAYHSYLITSLDLHTIELEDFKYGGTNITAFRLVDPTSDVVKSVVQDWVLGELRYGRKIPFHEKSIRPNSTIHPNAIATETALVYDAVQLFARALTDLDRSQNIQITPLDCVDGEPWQHGTSLLNYMKLVEAEGLTGKIQFDSEGFRSNFDLEIIELKKDGLNKVGVWNKETGANFTRNFTEAYSEIVESLHNKTLIITTILTEPYSMYKENSEALTGNARFEGYNVDLIDEISKILGFNYSFHMVEDGTYGSYDEKTKTWSGMIGELLSQKADLAVADLTITYEREQGVDFTMPFMNLGVTILFKKPKAKDPYLFSFLSPLALDVWIYMMTAYLAVSLLLFILARISPYETSGVVNDVYWRNDEKGSRLARPDPIYETLFSGCGRPVRTIGTQVEDRREQEKNSGDTFTLLNSFWFMIASLLQQGTDLLPRAVSTRMVAGMWWFFTLIMISSYTANLAAFLTVERMDSPIESAEDLAKQNTISYGSLRAGSTAAFFRDSKIPTYSRMWVFMDSDDKNFVKSNSAGVERVIKENGKYAFLMESTTVEYIVERKCDLTQIGGLLDSKGYGIALPPNSPFRTPISSAILQLQEGGKLHMLKEKWWKQRKGGGKCQEVPEKEAAALNLSNVGGVFVVLLGGLGVACIIAVAEYLWNKRQMQKFKPATPPPGHLSTCTTNSTLNTLTRPANSYENGQVTHLDLAAHAPVSHCPGENGVLSPMNDNGGFLTTSLSVAALNQTSCAVPHHSMQGWALPPSGGNGCGNPGPEMGNGPPPILPPTAKHHHHHSHRYHQEQCPHFSGFKEDNDVS
ncbi:glutamate receptor ionotropic, kainate 2 isoform X2 [Lepeophtheirus salmonis]|uniref:glutamate receptor ionotropic, kainate 2 isoform X2 n=1 Tax=Lepeophtheirus salmonis TaxID=72036 RepID=UPI003AF370E8